MGFMALLFACLLCESVVFGREGLAGEVSSSQQEPKRVLKWKVAIGRFSNETQYGKGLFYEKENDPLAKQALDLLSSKLASSGKFLLLERNDMDKIEQEVESGASIEHIGADYLILGSLTQFGRKVEGKTGVFTSEKKQKAEAGVSVRLVDVKTQMILYSDEAVGYAETSSKSTLGYGGKMGYDATLADKAISAALDQLVENIITKCDDKPWRTYILSSDDEGTVIAGGASQGLVVGDTFHIYTRGKKVKNPQTGITFELPGKKIGALKVDFVGGDTPQTEFALVTITEGSIDASALENYYVQEPAE